jgi:ribulose-phosphate 3-epimerase
MMIPAILPRNEAHLEASLARVRGVARDIQIDVVDGIYAGPASWPFDSGDNALGLRKSRGEMLPMIASFSFEVDLMVSEPEDMAGTFIDLGASRIVFHFGSARDLLSVIKRISHAYGYEREFAPGLLSLGVALSLDTPISVLKSYVDSVDFVQLMGIQHIGKQGEPFDPRVIGRAKELDHLYPHLPVQIDGGVSLENAPELLNAGIDRLVVGSDFWHTKDLHKTFEAFEALREQYGIYS